MSDAVDMNRVGSPTLQAGAQREAVVLRGEPPNPTCSDVSTWELP